MRAYAPAAGGRELRTRLRGKKAGNFIYRFAVYLGLTLALLALLVPSLWMVSTSFKPVGTELTVPVEWLPRRFEWRNYLRLMDLFPYPLYLRNTLTYTANNVIATVVTASMVAYSFARLRWRHRGLVFAICLSTMMLPGIVTMIPTFIIFKHLGWMNTMLPLTVPTWFGGGAFNIFLLRQFLMGLPIELDEAARMDGANGITIWSRIVLPLSRPVLATVAILSFIGNWNDFMGPLLYLNDKRLLPLSLGLNTLNASYMGAGASVPMVAYIMAATVLTILPILIIFFLGQRYFVQGIVMTGLAGT